MSGAPMSPPPMEQAHTTETHAIPVNEPAHVHEPIHHHHHTPHPMTPHPIPLQHQHPIPLHHQHPMPIQHQHQHEHHEMDDQRSLRTTGTDICAKYKRESWLEKKGIYDEVDENAGFGPASGLQRKLKNRHVAMISIGGVIGTGLFLGTAESLEDGGPMGLLFGYTFMGTIVYCVMISLGEMIAYLPIPGGHIKLAERFVNPALSFAMGWNYWYTWMIALPAELSATATLMHYWVDKKYDPLWIVICFVVVLGINLLGSGAYGEAEFFFASIKVLTITGLIIMGIILDLGGGPNRTAILFQNWKTPFVQFNEIPGSLGQFLGFWAVVSNAAFSFIGTEIVAIAAGEAKNPRRNLPKAIKRVYVRILLFYIGGTLIIGLLVKPTDPVLTGGKHGTASASPFVVAIKNAGIKGLPSVINGALVTSAWSAASSDLYTSSRALYGLAVAGNGPQIFKKTTRSGLPLISVIFNSFFAFFAFMSQSGGSALVFGYFKNLSAIAGLMTWFGIGITYVRFHAGLKAQGFDRKKLPYSHALQPFAGWYTIFGTLIVCFFSGFKYFLKGNWNGPNFVTQYLSFLVFFVLYGLGCWMYRQHSVKAKDMDFITDLADIEAETYDEAPPKNGLEKFWAWLM